MTWSDPIRTLYETQRLAKIGGWQKDVEKQISFWTEETYHIHGFLELLQMKVATVIDDQGRHYIDNISDATQKMGRLIDELRAFSRMVRYALSFRKVVFEELVCNIQREIEPETAGRTIDWRIGDLPNEISMEPGFLIRVCRGQPPKHRPSVPVVGPA